MLRADEHAIFRAASAASKLADYLLQFDILDEATISYLTALYRAEELSCNNRLEAKYIRLRIRSRYQMTTN